MCAARLGASLRVACPLCRERLMADTVQRELAEHAIVVLVVPDPIVFAPLSGLLGVDIASCRKRTLTSTSNRLQACLPSRAGLRLECGRRDFPPSAAQWVSSRSEGGRRRCCVVSLLFVPLTITRPPCGSCCGAGEDRGEKHEGRGRVEKVLDARRDLRQLVVGVEGLGALGSLARQCCSLTSFQLASAMTGEYLDMCTGQGANHVCQIYLTCQRNER